MKMNDDKELNIKEKNFQYVIFQWVMLLFEHLK